MVGGVADIQPGAAAPLVDLNLVDDRAYLGFHTLESDHRVELGEQVRIGDKDARMVYLTRERFASLLQV